MTRARLGDLLFDLEQAAIDFAIVMGALGTPIPEPEAQVVSRSFVELEKARHAVWLAVGPLLEDR